MSETTTKRVRTTTYATGVAKGKRITKTKTYSVAEVADLCDVTTYAVLRWIDRGYVQSTKQPVEGSKRVTHQITGEALADFFALRKQHAKEVAARRSEREAKAAARAVVAQPEANEPAA